MFNKLLTGATGRAEVITGGREAAGGGGGAAAAGGGGAAAEGSSSQAPAGALPLAGALYDAGAPEAPA